MEQLKPCPFCGSSRIRIMGAIGERGLRGECPNCGMMTKRFEKIELLIDFINHRPLIDELVEAANFLLDTLSNIEGSDIPEIVDKYEYEKSVDKLEQVLAKTKGDKNE